MWTPGPFETRPSRAYYYLTDADPAWPAERQEEHLRDFNIPKLWSISIHEVYPGHFLHYQHLRQVGSKLRKSTLFSPASFVEGWAHYCEQMMVEAGFGREDPTIRLGQLAETLVRLVRGDRGGPLHAESLQGLNGIYALQTSDSSCRILVDDHHERLPQILDFFKFPDFCLF
jgi:hypothetical protein